MTKDRWRRGRSRPTAGVVRASTVELPNALGAGGSDETIPLEGWDIGFLEALAQALEVDDHGLDEPVSPPRRTGRWVYRLGRELRDALAELGSSEDAIAVCEAGLALDLRERVGALARATDRRRGEQSIAELGPRVRALAELASAARTRDESLYAWFSSEGNDDGALEPDLDRDVELGLVNAPPGASAAVPVAGARSARRLGKPAAVKAGEQPGTRWLLLEGGRTLLAGAVRNRCKGRLVLVIEAAYASRVPELIGADGPRRPGCTLRTEDGTASADATTLRPFRSIVPLPDDPVAVDFTF